MCLYSAPKQWKKVFYRLLDSNDLDPEDKDRLQEIEARTFKEIKEDVSKKFTVGWDGGIEVNREADKTVANKIRNSLRIYEKSKPKHQQSFFLFK